MIRMLNNIVEVWRPLILLGKNSSKEFVPLPETYAKLGIFCLSVCV